MARLPKKVKIGPYIYDVEIQDTPVAGDKACLAYQDFDRQVLAIKKDTKPAVKRMAVVHESMHAMYDLAEFQEGVLYSEEEVVSRLSPLIVQFIQDNPKLMEYITND